MTATKSTITPSKIIIIMFILLMFFMLFAVGSCVLRTFGTFTPQISSAIPPMSPSVLVLDIDGIIIDSKKFLRTLNDHISDSHIKAVVIRVNSPGGAVGPSQEMYRELTNIRKEYKKPVIMSFNSVAASGAYYISLGADKIVTNPGSIVGSIGVIMDLANMEELYEWAMIERYSIKTGKFKDTGSSYRTMTTDERYYLQNLLDELLDQFKAAISEGRNLSSEVVEQFSDGRVFTGRRAVALGFADEVGNFSDALKLASELSGFDELKIFEPNRPRLSFLGMLHDLDSSMLDALKPPDYIRMLHLHLVGRPLFLMPSYLSKSKP